MKKILSFVLTILICNAFVFAETEDDEDIIVVSAGKIEQSLSESIEHVQVLTQEDIKESGAKTLTEAIKNLSGVTVKTASAGNPTDSISMQGFSSSYVKILVDGIEVAGDINGSPAVFSLPIEDVDHIEVIQGASSSLYGSDAMGGVINIISKKNKDFKDKFTCSGSFTEEFSASVIGDIRNYTGLQTKFGYKNFSAGITGSFDFAPGTKKKTNDVLAGIIDYYETQKKIVGMAKINMGWTDDWGNVGLYGLYNFADQLSNFSPIGFDKSATMEYDIKRAESGLTGEVKITNDFLMSGFISAKYFNLFTEQETKATGSIVKKPEKAESLEFETELRSVWDLNDYNKFLFGLHANVETIEGDSFGSMKNQVLLSAYGQDTINLIDGRLSIIPGGRIDVSPSGDGNQILFQATPKLSVKYDITENSAIRFAYGMGYKIPSLKQKFWVFRHSYASGAGNFILNGNPNLKSETSHGFNLRYENNINNLFKIDLGGYFNFVNNMITSVVTDSTCDPQLRTYENVNKGITYGGDISLSTKLDRFDCKISYAYTDARQLKNNLWEPLTLRVNHRVTAGFGYKIPVVDIDTHLDAEWNSPQLIAKDDTDGDLYSPDYLMFSLFVGKKILNDKLEFYLRANNLLNNFSFIKGTSGTDQKQYYGLNAGTTFTVGGKFNW